jgi:aminoglycoside phosphotransferase (APT) family kinase protein
MRAAITPSTELVEELLGTRVRRYVRINPREGGAHSSTFELATDRGDFVLRVPVGRQGFYTTYLPRAIPRCNWFDQRWALDVAHDLAIPAPRVIVSHRHGPRFVVLTRLDGLPIRDFDTWNGCPYDESELGVLLARLHSVVAPGYGPIDDFGHTYFTTWPAFLQAVASRALSICEARASISTALANVLRERWYLRLAEIPLERPALLHLESLGFANLLYDPVLRSITGLLDYEDCVGGDPLFELTWMTYYLGDRDRTDGVFNFRRFEEGYGRWPNNVQREKLYLMLMYLEKLAWIDPHGARALTHRQALAALLDTF